MASKTGTRVIAIEEHYTDTEVSKQHGSAENWPKPLAERLGDLGELRLKEMDAAGVDMQVLSLCAPATHNFAAEIATPLALGANDRLYQTVKARPDRFAAFATLPTPDPKAAADELERCVTKLGFKGAMVHGLTNGLFIDDKRFWPIFERAQALDVPIYIHPSNPHPAVTEVYYKDYVENFPWILTAGWGFTVETATQGVRLVLSGIFDAYPNLNIIIGHLGESLPFSLSRIDEAFSRPGNKPISFREAFCDHFHITTSGNFSDPALLCCVQEIGVDRIMFAIDWPFVKNDPGVEWLEQTSLCAEDRIKILSGNAERLLRL